MILKTALAGAFLVGAVSLGHQALDRLNRTEALAVSGTFFRAA